VLKQARTSANRKTEATNLAGIFLELPMGGEIQNRGVIIVEQAIGFQHCGICKFPYKSAEIYRFNAIFPSLQLWSRNEVLNGNRAKSVQLADPRGCHQPKATSWGRPKCTGNILVITRFNL